MPQEATRLIPIELPGSWRVARGKWQISRDQRQFSYLGYPREDDPNQDGLCLSDHQITDGVFEAEILLNEVVPSGTNGHLVFRYHDPELYSFAGLGGWESKYVIAQRTPSESALRQPGWAPVAADAKIQDLRPLHWYAARVDFSGHNIDFYIGNVCVLRYTSTQRSPYYPVGNIGFRAFGKWRVRFRNPRLFQRVRASDVRARLSNLDISFMASRAIKAVANKDLEQLRVLDAEDAPKAVVVLLGSVAEAMLLDVCTAREAAAKRAAPPKSKSILSKWDLDTLIEVAKNMEAISDNTYSTSQTLRGYRNLIHPGRPEAQELAPWPSQAIAAIDFVVSLAKDLTRFARST